MGGINMNSKIFNHIKKVIIATAIIVLCSTSAAYGFMGWPPGKNDQQQSQQKTR